MTPGDSLLYVYGIVRDAFDASRAPTGVDDARVEVVKGGSMAALVSRVSDTSYGPDAVEEKSGDVSWLSPRAMSHDRVLTWAQEHGGVIPFPMFSLWGSETALTRSLDERASSLKGVFTQVADADEFGLRVHRRDSAMLESIDKVDQQMAQLRREAGASTPGQRYLLERKLAEQGKQAVKAASQRMAKQVFDDLRAIARDSVALPLTPKAGEAVLPDVTLVLNGAFLVDRRRLEEFRHAVGAIVREFQPRGLSFDFTGPWPPYNFVSEGDVSGEKSSK
jgi:hypothetical protein